MIITEVTYGLTLTQSLPGYNNIKPSMSLTARLEEGDDAGVAVARLSEVIHNYLEEEVNQALEVEGKAARYHNGPTYQIMTNRDVFVVIPDDKEWFPDGYYHSVRGGASRGLRLSNAIEKAKRLAGSDDKFVDCSDGDLSRLPPKPEDEDYELREDDIPF